MMKKSIAGRTLITLDGDGISLQGTMHEAYPQSSAPVATSSEESIGVVFANSFSTPRAAFGDTAIEWADVFAACGFPAFRFDLPGLGDSGGTTPEYLLDHINEGRYGPILAQKANELVKRFDLAGVVLVGHCAGAVSALFAASKLDCCKGLVLMDPYFHLPNGIRQKVPVGLVDWTKRSRLGRSLIKARLPLAALRRALSRRSLPANANLSLLQCWAMAASRQIPTLVLRALRADTAESAPLQFDYVAYMLSMAASPTSITLGTVNDTDHCFANQEGRDTVRQHIQGWLPGLLSPAVSTQTALHDFCSDGARADRDFQDAYVPAQVKLAL